jgi:bacillithiol biosynthesis cysteine-adding enzyme BshC
MTSIRIHSAPFAAVAAVPAIPGVMLSPEVLSALRPGPGTDRLAAPGALAVTTGQQPGLFGGPMYTVHKALAARALAAEIERRLGRPVVPVFWLAGDDHDWAEASRAVWWTGRDDVREWNLPSRAVEAPQLAMSHEDVPVAAVRAARDQLATDLTPGPDRDAALAWIDRHWRAGATMGSAFADALNELLAPLGIACLDATAMGMKRAQVPVLRAALIRSDAIDRTLAALPDTGTGITAGDRATLVFVEGVQGRDRLIRVSDHQFITRRGGESFDAHQLDQLLEAQPERFSANVLLRPVVEAALLPTVAYVAGPGEARYLSGPAASVYPILGVTPQAVIRRWSGSVIDATSDRLLQRLDLDVDQVLRGDRDTERRLLRGDMPETTLQALESLDRTIDATISALRPDAHRIDPVLDRALDTRQHHLHHVADNLRRLLERHLKKRDDVAWSQYQRLRRRVCPLNAPQERVITVAAAWGRWGDEWLTRAADAAADWASQALEPAPRSP